MTGPPAGSGQERARIYNGRYELIRQIARGGTAQVYLARDLLLDRPVALKVLFPELSSDRSFVDRFRREAQAAANLSHPNIVPIFDWGESDRTYFIVMEHVDGEPLSAIVRSQAPLPAARSAGIAADIAKALSYAHRHGVVHRDVKPGNVLITRDGQVKVADFGIARAVGADDNVTQTGLVMGTATYFSPEQAQGLGVDGRSDVYSLGVVLYEMVTGRPPFTADTPVAIAYKHVSEMPVPPRELEPRVPAALEAIILRAMAKQPSDRYPTAEDLHADLQRYAQGSPVMAMAGAGAAAGLGLTAAMGAGGLGATQAIVPNATTMLPTESRPSSVATSVQQRSELVGGAPAERPEMPKRRWIGWVLAGLILAVLLAVLLYLGGRWLGYFGAEGYLHLPDVRGKTVLAATAQLRADGLKVQSTSNHNSHPAGTVYLQTPRPHTEIQQGQTVYLTYSEGLAKVAIPPVLDKQYTIAKSELQAKGFKVKLVPERPTSGAETQGLVTATSPPPYADVVPGTTVKVFYVQGLQQVKVPAVTNDTVAQATFALAKAQLQVGGQQTQTSGTVKAGDVIATNPAAGLQEPAGSNVTLIVSSGPPANVPNVKFESQNNAENAIRAAGLVPSVVTANGPPGEAGFVLDQSPGPNTQVARGTTVTITVDRPQPTTTTTTTTTTTQPHGPPPTRPKHKHTP